MKKALPLYDPAKIEKKWQAFWAKKKLYASKESKSKEKFYVLDMFPYPSGEGLHVGHPKGYIATDVVSRMKRMQGMNVLHPMGFDAFGLPAENYAIKTKTHPSIAVAKNVARYKQQLELLGFDYDWSREVNTTDPAYYKWTQWIFLQLWKKGLAFESYEPINWCPSCKTGLANEDIEDGRCERCGTPVEKKPMRQWVLRITDYADRLLKDLDAKKQDGSNLLDWPESIKELQRNWIGRSEGAEIEFELTIIKNKPNFLILHGFEGSAKTNFIPWLKAELQKKGCEVQAPELPNSFSPKESEQVEYVLKNCKIDENTVIIGHSLGAITAMKALMKRNKPVSGLLIVAAAKDPTFPGSGNAPYKKNYSWDIDYERIKALTGGKIAVLSDLNEPKRMAYLKWLSGKLSAGLIETRSKEEHFCAPEEPAVLACCTPTVKVFTTRPDTIFGVTYLVMAPEHMWVGEFMDRIENKAEVQAYIEKARNESVLARTDATKEKTGVELKGIKAINPANGEEVPVWIADYVLADYGTGAVMAVPAHDERDYEFARKFKLPVKRVVEPKFVGTTGEGAARPGMPFVKREAVVAVVRDPKTDSYLCNSWKEFKMHGLFTGGLKSGEDPIEAAKREVLEETGYKNLKLVRKSDIAINTFFYQRVKKENRHAHFQYVFFELENDERDPVDPSEAAIHEVVWKKRGELEDFFTVFEGSFIMKILDGDDYVHTDEGLLVNSGQFGGKDSQSVMKEITAFCGGKWVAKYKLRDWVFSRQRYWGEPIPLIHCEKCGVVPVPEKELPVKLPDVKSYEPTGTGESPLASIDKWVNVKCPQCGGRGKRETNTMPQWAGSCWYYLRYEDPKNKKALVDAKKEKYWSPVDLYVGGAEHATRHLIYARFWHKFLFDIGSVSTTEPFSKLQSVGLIMGEDGKKMSKRFGNVVNPDDIVARYGADTLRIYEMFMGPFDQAIAWNTQSMVGSRRFIERVWKLADKVSPKAASDRVIHRTTKKVSEDIEGLRFNTAISTMMICLNELEKTATVGREDYESFLKLLAPFAPHVSEELWNALGNKKSIHISAWPTYDSALIQDETVTIVLQVNGKARGRFEAPAKSDRKTLENMALALPEAKKWLNGNTPKKIIVVPDRLVNIVA